MRNIEKIFRAIRCTEDDKVTLATYMLQERGDVWWSSLLRTRFEDGAVEVAFDHRTLDEELCAACRQEGEMEQYLEEKKASQKRPAAPFQRQERKKAAFQSPQHPVASGSSQVPSQPNTRSRIVRDFSREFSVDQPQQQRQQRQRQDDQGDLKPQLECLR
ncbi:hypothetical protein Taro_054268 [Colocasia esculenta]|uniref:Uncharacterized protein n=1 Tax=Colocasia esculenta TaxID=4460 RepID=A0A843XQ27_COLES|nr:hypothetical protein [Colocasia esculenta]